MSQRKKEGVREAILEAAFTLFRDHGYNETSLPAIARAAGISTANIYVYFESKLEILFTVYEPWLEDRLDRLERSLRRIKSPSSRLERLLMVVWGELPQEANGFANNVVQALSTSGRREGYSPHLRELFQSRVADWIQNCLELTAQESALLAGVVLMAFDGFAINVHLAHGLACDKRMVRLFAEMLARRPNSGDSDCPRVLVRQHTRRRDLTTKSNTAGRRRG